MRSSLRPMRRSCEVSVSELRLLPQLHPAGTDSSLAVILTRTAVKVKKTPRKLPRDIVAVSHALTWSAGGTSEASKVLRDLQCTGELLYSIDAERFQPLCPMPPPATDVAGSQCVVTLVSLTDTSVAALRTKDMQVNDEALIKDIRFQVLADGAFNCPPQLHVGPLLSLDCDEAQLRLYRVLPDGSRGEAVAIAVLGLNDRLITPFHDGKSRRKEPYPRVEERDPNSPPSKSKRVAQDVQRTAKMWFDIVKSAFEHTDSTSDDDSKSQRRPVAASTQEDNDVAGSLTAVSDRPVAEEKLRTVALPFLARNFTATSFTLLKPQEFGSVLEAYADATVERLPALCVLEDSPSSAASGWVAAASDCALPLIAVLFERDDDMRAVLHAWKELHDRASVRSSEQREDVAALPAVFTVASDLVCSAALPILAALAVAVMPLSPPTLELGFDDLPRAVQLINGCRTPAPRPNTFMAVLQRLKTCLSVSGRHDLCSRQVRNYFPVSVAVATLSDGSVVSIPFCKCLHILCAAGIQTAYVDTRSSSPSSSDSGDAHPKKRRMKRDPVMIGLYRVPCQGHFEYAWHAGNGMRIWTTRKHLEGLTMESNAIAPRIICTSLYGEGVAALRCTPALPKRCLAVVADSDRMPRFEEVDTRSDGYRVVLPALHGMDAQQCTRLTWDDASSTLVPLIPFTVQ